MTIGGLRDVDWLSLWNQCHESGLTGPTRVEWPDGGALVDQPNLTVNVFAMITQQAIAEAKSQEAQAKTG